MLDICNVWIAYLLSTKGTATTGFFFKPSIISGALSPYILKYRTIKAHLSKTTYWKHSNYERNIRNNIVKQSICYLCMAFLCMISDVPPRQLSNRNLAASSADIRFSFFCTASRTRIDERFVSMTQSNWKEL